MNTRFSKGLFPFLAALFAAPMPVIAADPYRPLGFATCVRQGMEKFFETNIELTPRQREFIEKNLVPIVGNRAVYEGPDRPRRCAGSASCLIIPEFNDSKAVRFMWTSGISKPRIEVTADAHTLWIPEGYDFTQAGIEGANLIRRLLVGHTLHPYSKDDVAQTERVALGEPAFVRKDVQVVVNRDVTAAIERGDRSYLYVATTGTGKTDFFQHVVATQIARGGKLHVITADMTNLCNQLAGNLRQMDGAGSKFEVIQWPTSKNQSVAELVQRAEHGGKAVVLVSTTKTLVDEAAKPGAAALLQRALSSFGYDEAQHTGAPLAMSLIKSIVKPEQSRAFLYAATATPFHQHENILELFDYKTHWAYIDPKRAEAVAQTRDELPMVIDQLEIATQRGELSPIHDSYFLNPSKILKDGSSIFTGRGRIPNEYQPAIAAFLKPMMKKHQQGFFSFATIEEAMAARDAVAAATGKRCEVWVGETKAGERDAVIEALKAGEQLFVFTAKVMDEGMDFPKMSLYVDMNKSVGPRQLLQRIGRIVRLAKGKTGVDMVICKPMDADAIRDRLRVMTTVDRISLNRDVEPEEKDPGGAPSTIYQIDRHAGVEDVALFAGKFFRAGKDDSRILVEAINAFGRAPTKAGQPELYRPLLALTKAGDPALAGIRPGIMDQVNIAYLREESDAAVGTIEQRTRAVYYISGHFVGGNGPNNRGRSGKIMREAMHTIHEGLFDWSSVSEAVKADILEPNGPMMVALRKIYGAGNEVLVRQAGRGTYYPELTDMQEKALLEEIDLLKPRSERAPHWQSLNRFIAVVGRWPDFQGRSREERLLATAVNTDLRDTPWGETAYRMSDEAKRVREAATRPPAHPTVAEMERVYRITPEQARALEAVLTHQFTMPLHQKLNLYFSITKRILGQGGAGTELEAILLNQLSYARKFAPEEITKVDPAHKELIAPALRKTGFQGTDGMFRQR